MASQATLQERFLATGGKTRRGARRSQAALPVLVHLMGRSHSARLRNLSQGGAMIETEARLLHGDEIAFRCGGIDVRARVVWQSGTCFGLQFCSLVPERDLRAQILRADFLADRRTARGTPTALN